MNWCACTAELVDLALNEMILLQDLGNPRRFSFGLHILHPLRIFLHERLDEKHDSGIYFLLR